MTQMACPRCGAVFEDRDDLRDHYENCQGEGPTENQGGSGPDPRVKCGVCGQMFSSDLALGAHKLSGNCNVDI